MEIIKDDNFESTITKTEVAVVDFFAEWCGPCRQLAPMMEEMSKKYTDVTWAKVNVDESQSLAAKFAVSSIPTVIFFKNGKEVTRSIGFRPTSELEKILAEAKKA